MAACALTRDIGTNPRRTTLRANRVSERSVLREIRLQAAPHRKPSSEHERTERPRRFTSILRPFSLR